MDETHVASTEKDAQRRSVHGLLDELLVSLAGSALGKRKLFSQAIETPDYQWFLPKVVLDVPELPLSGTVEVPAQTPAGVLDPAFSVADWKGADFPTLIYHHGNNERPFDYSPFSKNTFRKILYAHRKTIPANLVALRAPFHQDLGKYIEKLSSLDNFVLMLSVSVKLIEALIPRLREQCRGPLIVCGSSLGGWVANLHRTYYNSADRYLPMFAGARLGKLFTDSVYWRIISVPARNESRKIETLLDFEAAFRERSDQNCFPLLSRYDRIIVFEIQKTAYEGYPLVILDKGHTTGVLASTSLRRFILSHL